jgi:hypothetical protein
MTPSKRLALSRYTTKEPELRSVVNGAMRKRERLDLLRSLSRTHEVRLLRYDAFGLIWLPNIYFD